MALSTTLREANQNEQEKSKRQNSCNYTIFL